MASLSLIYSTKIDMVFYQGKEYRWKTIWFSPSQVVRIRRRGLRRHGRSSIEENQAAPVRWRAAR